MIKTFDKQGNITKQAQKARFPKYVAYIDCKAATDIGIWTKAMEETELTAAMKRLENCVNNRREDVYLCGIYENTGKVNANGEPLYEMIIGARMGEYSLNGWHFWDEAHGETHHGLNRWYSNDYARDNMDEWTRSGHFEKE